MDKLCTKRIQLQVKRGGKKLKGGIKVPKKVCQVTLSLKELVNDPLNGKAHIAQTLRRKCLAFMYASVYVA